MDNVPVFITPEAVAEMLGVSLTWVYEKSRTRQRDPLPTLRIGRYLRFEKDAVIQWARNRGNTAAKKIAKERVQPAGDMDGNKQKETHNDNDNFKRGLGQWHQAPKQPGNQNQRSLHTTEH